MSTDLSNETVGNLDPAPRSAARGDSIEEPEDNRVNAESESKAIKKPVRSYEELEKSFIEDHSGKHAPRRVGARSIRVHPNQRIQLNGRTYIGLTFWVIRTNDQVRFGVATSPTAAKREMRKVLLGDKQDESITIAPPQPIKAKSEPNL